MLNINQKGNNHIHKLLTNLNRLLSFSHIYIYIYRLFSCIYMRWKHVYKHSSHYKKKCLSFSNWKWDQEMVEVVLKRCLLCWVPQFWGDQTKPQLLRYLSVDCVWQINTFYGAIDVTGFYNMWMFFTLLLTALTHYEDV